MTEPATSGSGSGAARSKVLYVCHNHPVNRPGGAELYAYELYQAVREAAEFEPVFVAKAGPPVSTMDGAPTGTRLAPVGDDPNQYFLYTDQGEFDRLFGTITDKRMYTQQWHMFLEQQQPDLVHFQHTLFLGYDMIRQTRNTLPDVPIVYTLHEFLPICFHNGQMVKVGSFDLCHGASPRSCHECFPRTRPSTFLLRKRYIAAAFDEVSLFIAPSEQLRRRYIEWGIPEARIRHEDYGRAPVAPLAEPSDPGPRKRFAFFGQITRYKGVDVLLEAMQLVAEHDPDIQLTIHGANLEHQAPEFQDEIGALLEQTAGSVTFAGRYEHDQLPRLYANTDWVVVPSIWWENSPLVIQEALMYGRPPIVSDVGGMAEAVRDGIDGLQFARGDARSLADAIIRAAGTPGLWDKLRASMRNAHAMSEHLPTLTGWYRELLGDQRAAAAG